MCDPVSIGIASIATAAASTGASLYSAKKQRKMQKQGMMQAQKDAADTRAANERAVNQANQKRPNLGALAASNRVANSAGVGSTMLTGAMAPAVNAGLLGRATLLGA